jgi:alkylhydroperoxidase/carboxymuconolactone decarboxylase family protein YurZ
VDVRFDSPDDPGMFPSDEWESLAALDPPYFRAAERVFGVAAKRGALSSKDRVLLEIALDALVTQLDARRLEEGIRRAAQLGVTRDEAVCVLELVAVIGMHSVTVGMPVLAEEADCANGPKRLSPHQANLAHAFETRRLRPRPLDPMFESILRLDPDYFERFIEFIDVPWREEVLDPRVKHLISIAIDVACTHLYVDGIRRHVREALSLGVTVGEIVEVIELASATGLRTLRAGLPVVAAVYGNDAIEGG